MTVIFYLLIFHFDKADFQSCYQLFVTDSVTKGVKDIYGKCYAIGIVQH